MSKSVVDVPPKDGFSFDLCRRNAMLSDKGVKPPSYRKTGTTIVGLIFQVFIVFSCFKMVICFILCFLIEMDRKCSCFCLNDKSRYKDFETMHLAIGIQQV